MADQEDLRAEIDRLKAATDLRAVVSADLSTKRTAKFDEALCPFHEERTPSFQVYRDHFHCFGCGAHGDVFDWLAKRRSLSLPQAIEHLGGASQKPNGHARADGWQSIIPPPPSHAEPPTGMLNGADVVYRYLDERGLLFCVLRYEATAEAKKNFIPVTFGTLDGVTGWHKKHPVSPRPLYGLDRLTARPDARVIVCEGEKSADAAQEMFPASCCISWEGGSSAVAQADWSPLKGRDVLIWPDNDTPGHKAAKAILERFPAAKVLRVDDLGDGHDAADVDPEDPEAWLAARIIPSKEKPKPASGFPFFTFAEAEFSGTANQIVDGLLSERAMSVVYGESNSGKTFFATDLALRLAAGMAWRDRAIEQGAVLYVAMEGTFGIRNRIVAFRQHHGLDGRDIPFAVVTVSLNMLDKNASAAAVVETAAAIQARFDVPLKLVVMDTLSRAMPGGNENSPEDMTALIGAGDKVREGTKAHLMWIHHCGKDAAKGARGHTSLRAATDTEIEIYAEGANRTARVTKQREIECAGEFRFILQQVELGKDDRGRPITSCVVDGGDQAASAAPDHRPRLKGHTMRALEILADLVATSGQEGFAGAPPGVLSVPEKWWRERFYDSAMAAAEPEAKQKAFRRSADYLVEQHRVGLRGGRVWLL